MADFRCPRHDVLFQTETDHKKPGSDKSHPKSESGIAGHPDCPMCKKEKKGSTRQIPSADPPAATAANTREIAQKVSSVLQVKDSAAPGEICIVRGGTKPYGYEFDGHPAGTKFNETDNADGSVTVSYVGEIKGSMITVTVTDAAGAVEQTEHFS